jgi:hypothetical protein
MSGNPAEWHGCIRFTPELLGAADRVGLRTLVILQGELYEVVGWEPPDTIVAAPLPMPSAPEGRRKT